MKTLDIGVFRHMKICCPQCSGLPTDCEACGETGLCCPTCNGAGKVAKHRKGLVSILLLCPTCQLDMAGGAQYNEVAVNRAIDQYILDWFEGRIEDPVLTARAKQDAVRKAREVSRPANVWKHG
jgi:ribosomal protein L37AE/L43A